MHRKIKAIAGILVLMVSVLFLTSTCFAGSVSDFLNKVKSRIESVYQGGGFTPAAQSFSQDSINVAVQQTPEAPGLGVAFIGMRKETKVTKVETPASYKDYLNKADDAVYKPQPKTGIPTVAAAQKQADKNHPAQEVKQKTLELTPAEQEKAIKNWLPKEGFVNVKFPGLGWFRVPESELNANIDSSCDVNSVPEDQEANMATTVVYPDGKASNVNFRMKDDTCNVGIEIENPSNVYDNVDDIPGGKSYAQLYNKQLERNKQFVNTNAPRAPEGYVLLAEPQYDGSLFAKISPLSSDSEEGNYYNRFAGNLLVVPQKDIDEWNVTNRDGNAEKDLGTIYLDSEGKAHDIVLDIDRGYMDWGGLDMHGTVNFPYLPILNSGIVTGEYEKIKHDERVPSYAELLNYYSILKNYNQ